MAQYLHFRILEFPLTAGLFRMKHPNQRMDDLGPMTSESSKVAPVGSGLRGSRAQAPLCVYPLGEPSSYTSYNRVGTVWTPWVWPTIWAMVKLHQHQLHHFEQGLLSRSNTGFFKTRCTPRTRMLTRMLMVQMSKHMDMESRRTLSCNSLFEQTCTYFPCYQSALWSAKYRVWSVEWKV